MEPDIEARILEGNKRQRTIIIVLIVMVVMFVGLSAWLTYDRLQKQARIATLTEEQRVLSVEYASTTEALAVSRDVVAQLGQDLSMTREELEELEDDYRKERRRNEDFEDQIDDLAGTIGKLDKLSKTDEELLQKYSKVYFLNENYVPSDLDEIDKRYILEGKKDQYFHADALPFLEDMLDDAKDDGIDLRIVSAYRSFDEQVDVKGHHTQVYGSGANTFSADQGYSEHQLGTTVDLSDPATGGAYDSFNNTEAYEWLTKNAHKYGFILSYPENNSFYIFEPWHWRFVGRELADDLYDDNKHFYDLDQRTIDKYLISIFD